MKTIEEVCVVNPRLPRGHNISDEIPVSFVPMAAVDEISGSITNGQVRRFAEVKKGFTHFMDNDVLFAKITPCMENGKAAIAKDLVGGLGFGSTEFHVLRSNGSVLPEWLFYFVRQSRFRAEAKRNFTGTAGQQRVPTTFLASTLIPVPSLEEQCRIVDILSRAEGIVRLRRDAEKKAAELIPALFLDMFGDPATNPKGWSVKLLGNLAANEKYAIKAGPFGSALKKEMYVPAGYKIYGQEQVIRGDLNYGDYYIDEIKYRELESCRIQTHDILISLVGTFGKICIVPNVFEQGIINPRLMKITLDRSQVLPVFIRALLTGSTMRGRIEERSHGGTMSIVNVGIMKSLEIIVPPLALQGEFCLNAEATLSIQSQQSAASAKAQATFDALLAQVFAN